MPTNQPHIASRVLNQPLLLEPGYARTFFSALSKHLDIKTMIDADGEVLLGEKMKLEASSFSASRTRERPYQVIDGVAVLPVSGTLVHKYGYLTPRSGMTGYDGIIARMGEATTDPEVKGILLDMDTPGGEVAGCFDAVQTIRAMAKDSGKPLWAVADDMACSAGMAVASAADRRLITQSAMMGSVGVVMAHQSLAGKLKEDGIKVTLIHSGAHKVDGNPYEDLSKDVLDTFQAKADKSRQAFAELVSANIGLSVEAILATEAATFRGQEAIDVGFADQLVNGNEAIAIFADFLNQPKQSISGVTMASTETTNPAVLTQPEKNSSEGALQMSATEMQQRIRAITKCEEAKGREDLAEHFAYDTSMSAEDAKAALAKAPIAQEPDKASAKAHSDKLNELMTSEGNPKIVDDVEESAEVSEVDQIMSAYNMAKGA